jgi:SRSO17 transposase
MMERVKRQRAKRGDTRPICFFIIDDTQCVKNWTTQTMEALSKNYSHSDGKVVWSHCIVTAHFVSDDYSFAWDFRSYFSKEYCQENSLAFKSKNDLAIELVQSYETQTNEQVYVLVDSWYTSQKLIDACSEKGFHVIGGLRTNRKIYPAGIGIKASEYASTYIEESDLHSVTVGSHSYKVYLYEGNLSDVENVKALLSWENDFSPNKTPFCILCTDSSLDVVTILRYYEARWNIETGYRYFKDLLGFDEYQLLSHQGIERFWAIEFLAYNFLEHQRQEWKKESLSLTIGDVVRRIRKDYLGQLVVYSYEQAIAHKPLAQVLEEMKLSA